MTKFDFGVITGNAVQEVFSDAKKMNKPLPQWYLPEDHNDDT